MVSVDLSKALPLYGSWQPDKNALIFRNTYTDAGGEGKGTTHGLALLNQSVEDGSISCRVKITGSDGSPGAMVIFRANGQEIYYAAGLGGWEHAYSLMEGNRLQFNRIAGVGNSANLELNREYHLRIVLEGQRVDFYVDGIKVITHTGVSTTNGVGTGLFAFRGTVEASFTEFAVDGARPKAFIAMQFSSPYNEVYRDAIEPLISEVGLEPVRVDDISEPTIIIQDIRNNVTEASIVIADISERNANVYYEVGMAHALNKPTVLLAQQGTSLPFDVGPYRCIFYENSIPGRAKLQEALRRSLTAAIGISDRNGNS